MKSLLILILPLTLIYGCSSTDDSNQSDSSQLLIGTWTHTYLNQCSESHTFDGTSNWTVTTPTEIASGTYTFNEVDSSLMLSISVSILLRNDLLECSENFATTFGGEMFYISFPTNTSMEWHSDMNNLTPDYILEKN